MPSRSSTSSTCRRTTGQVVVCRGCCGGRTDRGHPDVPVDWLKRLWRERRLAPHVQLTISGCLGPCDACNVALIFLGDRPVWLGGLSEQRDYATLLEWAEACARTGQVEPLPPALRRFEMRRFKDEQDLARRFG